MSKTLNFTYEGKNYSLGYNRKTIQMMEQAGFVVREIEDKPLSLLPKLFAGAFLLNHKHTSQAEIEMIYDAMSDKDGLMSALIDLYQAPLQALFEEPKEGNVTWTVS